MAGMDELHTLALDVAHRVVESGDEDPAIVAIARLLLEEAARTAAPPPPPPPAPPMETVKPDSPTSLRP